MTEMYAPIAVIAEQPKAEAFAMHEFFITSKGVRKCAYGEAGTNILLLVRRLAVAQKKCSTVLYDHAVRQQSLSQNDVGRSGSANKQNSTSTI